MGAWLTKLVEDEKPPPRYRSHSQDVSYTPQRDLHPPLHENRQQAAASSPCIAPPTVRVYAPSSSSSKPLHYAVQAKTTAVLRDDHLPVAPVPSGPESLPPQNSVLFLDEVSEWTLQDVVNDQLLVHKVRKIPERFWDVQQYLDFFKWPLVEEVRAQLHESLKMIGNTPYARVHKVQQCVKGRFGVDLERTRIDVLVDSELVQRGDTELNETPEKVQLVPKDLVLLSTTVPRSFADLDQDKGELHTFALVLKLETKENPKSDAQMWIGMATHTSKERIRLCQELLNGKRTWYALYLNSLATTLRICEALHPRELITKSSFPIIRETLYIDRPLKCVINARFESLGRNGDALADAAREYCSSSKLNKSQMSAIVEIVSDSEKQRPPFVRMIQGPPGTGKTSTIVRLLALTSCMNLKCLVTAPTNAAIAELALRYSQFLTAPAASSEKVQLTRFRTKIAPGRTSVELKDVVLLGNYQKLFSKGELQDLFLPQRVQRLMAAQNGWKNSILSMLNLLVSGESQYEQKRREIRGDNLPVTAHEDGKNYPASFLNYVKVTLPKLVTAAELHSESLVRELPSRLIDEKKVLETLDLAIKLRNLVLNLDSSIATQFPGWFTTTSSSLSWTQPNKMDVVSRKNSLREEVVAATTALRYHLEAVSKAAVYPRGLVEDLITKTARVVFCTVAAAGRKCVKDAKPFNLLIIDEAGQLNEAETAIVSQMPGLSHAILVGDHQQLRATIISQVADKRGYGRSLFERLQILGHPSYLLSIQYRMHPAISSFPNAQFYDGRIADGENVKSAQYEKIYQKILYGPFAFIDVREGPEAKGADTANRSKKNPAEVALLSIVLGKLSKVILAYKLRNVSVGVIAPYASQVNLLRKHLRAHPNMTLEINSVDGFQGQEMDIILVSTVRANDEGSLGFLKDHRRMNVALTRARYCSWVVGNARTLSLRDTIWAAFVRDAMNKKMYICVGDDVVMQKEVQRIKQRIQKIDFK